MPKRNQVTKSDLTPAFAQSRRALYRLTDDFTNRLFDAFKNAPNQRERDSLLAGIVELITDGEPEASLAESMKKPMSIFEAPKNAPVISPQEMWATLEEGARFWCPQVKKAAAALEVGSGRAPSWKQIEKYFEGIGFRAVPVISFTGPFLYSYMIANRLAPVFTRWQNRYRLFMFAAPTIDVLHDLGHGLAMAMPDYRQMLIDYSEAIVAHAGGELAGSIEEDFMHYFEVAQAIYPDGRFEPIGATTLTFESCLVANDKLMPIPLLAGPEKKAPRVAKSFSSRDHWRECVEKSIRAIDGFAAS